VSLKERYILNSLNKRQKMSKFQPIVLKTPEQIQALTKKKPAGKESNKKPFKAVETKQVSGISRVLSGVPVRYMRTGDDILVTYAVNPDQLKSMVGNFDFTTRDSMVLRVAAKCGIYKSVVIANEAGADPSAKNNQAIQFAAENGYDDIVSYLMKQPNTNPADNNNEALRLAKKYKHERVIQVLESDSRVSPNTVPDDALSLIYL